MVVTVRGLKPKGCVCECGWVWQLRLHCYMHSVIFIRYGVFATTCCGVLPVEDGWLCTARRLVMSPALTSAAWWYGLVALVS